MLSFSGWQFGENSVAGEDYYALKCDGQFEDGRQRLGWRAPALVA
jgi:hypothetical protein